LEDIYYPTKTSAAYPKVSDLPPYPEWIKAPGESQVVAKAADSAFNP
jgi:hypothetical protein